MDQQLGAWAAQAAAPGSITAPSEPGLIGILLFIAIWLCLGILLFLLCSGWQGWQSGLAGSVRKQAPTRRGAANTLPVRVRCYEQNGRSYFIRGELIPRGDSRPV